MWLFFFSFSRRTGSDSINGAFQQRFAECLGCKVRTANIVFLLKAEISSSIGLNETNSVQI